MRSATSAPSDQRGSATIELAVLSPVLLILLGLVIAAGRVSAADTAIEQAAAAAARSASVSRDARTAESAARQTVVESLQGQGLDCATVSTSVDTAGFAIAVGRSAAVTVAVRCSISLGDLAVPGLPGSTTVAASATSPLDRYRGRR